MNFISKTACLLQTGLVLSQDNLDSVEALIKKHDDFSKLLDTQEEKFVSLEQFAKTLISGGHYDTLAISKRSDIVLQRCVHVTKCTIAYRCIII